MSAPRRAYLDWLRGVAVLCMIEWHVISAWSAADAHSSPAWPILVLIGGQAAPLFLFLAGLAVPFAINSHINRGATLGRASWLVQKRGWEVFLIAHLFRLQMFITNPRANWSSLFKPDILNILGLGLVATAWLSGRTFVRRNPTVLLGAAAAVLMLTPLSRQWWWPTLLPGRLEAYIRPNGQGVFELFPWIAYVPAGALAGLLLAQPRGENEEKRLHWRLAIAGAVMAAIGYWIASTPLSAPLEFWTAVPSKFVMQIGWITLGIFVAWLWMRTPIANATSRPLLLFGRTSLFVYWVHVEIAFGFLSFPLHGRLPLWQAVVGFMLVTIAMYFAAEWWEQRSKQPWIPADLRAKAFHREAVKE